VSRPTDNDRLWSELVRQGRLGVHSFDIRAKLHSGNPSQRITELEALHDCVIPRRREKRGGRTGVRYFHPDYAPDQRAPSGLGGDAVPPPLAAEPSRVCGRSRPAASAEARGPSLSGPDAGAADLDRSPEEAEQLGLIPTLPAIYGDAA